MGIAIERVKKLLFVLKQKVTKSSRKFETLRFLFNHCPTLLHSAKTHASALHSARKISRQHTIFVKMNINRPYKNWRKEIKDFL